MKYPLSILLISSAISASNNTSSPPPLTPQRSLDSLRNNRSQKRFVRSTQPITILSPSAKNHSKSEPHLPADIKKYNNAPLISTPPGLPSSTNNQSVTFPGGPPPERPPRPHKLTAGSASYESLPYYHKKTSKAQLKQPDFYSNKNNSNPPITKKRTHKRNRSQSTSALPNHHEQKSSTPWEKPHKSDLLIPSKRTQIREAKRSSKRFGKHRTETLSQQLFALTNVKDLLEAPGEPHRENASVSPEQFEKIMNNQASIVELLLELENQGAKRLAILKKIEQNTSKIANSSDSLEFWAKEAERLTKKVNQLLQVQVTTIEDERKNADDDKKEKKSKSIASFSSIILLSPRSRSKTSAALTTETSKRK